MTNLVISPPPGQNIFISFARCLALSSKTGFIKQAFHSGTDLASGFLKLIKQFLSDSPCAIKSAKICSSNSPLLSRMGRMMMALFWT